ncbi:trafficking particle complex subunit 4 [Raphidocelis subcapitata]|uniref:Trafficking protein particle complex subunit n=1 Tax=Raphidocelis subcapitata TaxID=307507 RepID=A0A2V0NTH4_9CHLO|nr:trafficking particle complex subunit 4 [Raphidocelis subcapitata]|eukprot:GBF88227.1 trafficking particle complex subunit 4 [Raphidocelis subcapitata]
MSLIYSLYVINKSGGLIFSRDFEGASRLDLNDSLRLASIWHSLHAIAGQLSPAHGCGGIELLSAESFDLHCFTSPTGTKFLLLVEPQCPQVPALLGRIYELYADFVLKNPFYEVEQVIKCELFDQAVDTAVRRYPLMLLSQPAGQGQMLAAGLS